MWDKVANDVHNSLTLSSAWATAREPHGQELGSSDSDPHPHPPRHGTRRLWLRCLASLPLSSSICEAANTNSRSLLKLMPIESVMPSSHLILCCPFSSCPPIPPSIRVFPSDSALHIGWPKYWSFSFSISPSNEHPRLTSFRLDWLDLFAVRGTLESLLQHHSSKASNK